MKLYDATYYSKDGRMNADCDSNTAFASIVRACRMTKAYAHTVCTNGEPDPCWVSPEGEVIDEPPFRAPR